MPFPPDKQKPATLPSPETIWIDGELVPTAEAKVSVFDHGLLYGDGVFEGIRAYGGRVLKLRSHLERLYASARAIRLAIPQPIDALTAATKQTCEANGIADGYIRLLVTRGDGPLGINPYQCHTPRTIIIAAKIELFPQALVDRGIRVGFSSYTRSHPQTLSPRVKSLNYLNNIMAKAEAVEAGYDEAVMFNEAGYIAEGSAENLFIVRRGRDGSPEVATPSLASGPLGGITRGIVLDLCAGLGISTAETQLTRFDLQTADEAFVTGTGAEIVPVVSAAGEDIADGTPGPTTARIREAFAEYVKHAPED